MAESQRLMVELGPLDPTPGPNVTTWCIGCDRLVFEQWMKFTKTGQYWCDRCRGDVIAGRTPVVVYDLSGTENPDLVAVQSGSWVETMTHQQYQERFVQ
jgi:hypothetical protein